MYVSLRCGIEFTQSLASRGIDRDYLPRRDLKISNHAL